jgi:type 2 lantibiotic biosynthesis protein LanM
MAFTAADLRVIVARSSTLAERMTGMFTAVDEPPALVGARFDRLRQRVAGGDEVRFARYLQRHDRDRSGIVRALGVMDYTGDELPAWTEILTQLDARAIEPRTNTRAHTLEPFEETLAPFLDAAREGLRARLPASGRDVWTCRAWPALERGLLRQLARIAGRTLFAEFGAFRLRRRRARDGVDELEALSRALAPAVGLLPRVDYDDYLAHLRHGRLDRVLLAYPVLARLLATRVCDWIESSTEFLRRIAADATLLAETFAAGRPLGPICEVVPDLSDPHRGGRTVSRVSFASGLQLIYKPRSLTLEAACSSLLQWLNDGRVPLTLKAPTVLDRGSYGWMEDIPAEPCADAAAVERYYVRVGMLLCIAYVLGGSDLHQGNLIASGEQPVLIDLEAFMNAPLQRSPTSTTPAHDADRQPVWDSLLRTGLLPVNRVGLRGQSHRNGGLVEIDPGYGRRVPRWEHLNTDLMTFAMGSPARHRTNLPHLGETPMRAEDHVDAVIDGFTEMSSVLQRWRRDLLCPAGPLQAFRGARARIVLRDTGAYATLLDRGLHPRLLRDGVDWSIEFELLEATTTGADSASRPAAISLAEQRALARLDIPLFTAVADDTRLEGDDGEPVRDYLTEAGYEGAIARIAELDDAGTRVHVQCIQLALRSRPHRSRDDAAASADECRLLSEAVAIGRTLRSIVAQSGGGLDWMGIRGLGGSARRGLHPVGWDLYGGRCGIAVFFAALARRGLMPDAPSFATRILAPLVDSLHAGTAGVDEALGAFGAGGIVYALTLAARLLDAEWLLDAATCAAERITPEAIDADARLDIMSGAAGAALGLLSLADARPQPWILDRARRCGHHLLGGATEAAGGCGFAHGSAGVAYALARLYRRTGVTPFRDAARSALSRRAGDDGDGAGSRGAAMRRSYCQGTAGVGLARLEAARIVDCPDLLAGFDTVLEDLGPDSEPSPSDHVCCGNAGRLELLACAADVLDEPRWRTAAHVSAMRMIERATVRGSYTLSGIDDVFCPGFYQGLAGIGYQLLRVHARDLPSVLIWE